MEPRVPGEPQLSNELPPTFQRFGSILPGISVDGVWGHIASAREQELRFPLLTNSQPEGAVVRAGGVCRRHDGTIY